MKIITAIFLILYILIEDESNKVQAVSIITITKTVIALETPCAQTNLNGGLTSKKEHRNSVSKRTKKKQPSKEKEKPSCFITYRGCREKCRWVDACMEECRHRYYQCIDSNWDTDFLDK
ncbi:uncharacterized protein LOC142980343 [Anticarsia gemmatalis]|uniref:uncharacterized protein LOC142980343 n=1 Tax=Anticarsia gemmatalis TaxID=129554 RepID=UPI003F7684BF